MNLNKTRMKNAWNALLKSRPGSRHVYRKLASVDVAACHNTNGKSLLFCRMTRMTTHAVIRVKVARHDESIFVWCQLNIFWLHYMDLFLIGVSCLISRYTCLGSLHHSIIILYLRGFWDTPFFTKVNYFKCHKTKVVSWCTEYVLIKIFTDFQ